MSEAERDIISAENYAVLESRGEVFKLPNGRIEVHQRALNGFSDSLPKFNIPSSKLYSAESLEWCGLTADMARKIHDVWSLPLERGPYGMKDYIRINIENIGVDACDMDNDKKWDKVLDAMGVSEVLKGIMNSEFVHVRMQKTAREWTVDFVTGLWVFLESVDKKVEDRFKWERRRAATSAPAAAWQSGNTVAKLFPEASSTKPSDRLWRR